MTTVYCCECGKECEITDEEYRDSLQPAICNESDPYACMESYYTCEECE